MDHDTTGRGVVVEYTRFSAVPAVVPDELTELRQWILWRGEEIQTSQGSRVNKIPIDVQTLTKASTTDPMTWASSTYCGKTLPAALEEWSSEEPAGACGGLGFVFTADDPYCGVDLDHVIDPPGTIQPWAQQLVQAFRTYTEVSPSGTGLHLLGRGTLGQGRKRGPIEVYDRARFFTVTGQHVDGSPLMLKSIQTPLDWLLTCLDVLVKALERYGERFSPLFAGQWQGSYPSQSEGDLGLCRLAVQDTVGEFRCFGNPGTMRAMFPTIL
jgi:primase-polymerase (primpol)-like protein